MPTRGVVSCPSLVKRVASQLRVTQINLRIRTPLRKMQHYTKN